VSDVRNWDAIALVTVGPPRIRRLANGPVKVADMRMRSGTSTRWTLREIRRPL